MRIRRSSYVLLAIVGFSACSGGTGAGDAVELRFSAQIEPTAYVVEYEQDIQWGTANVERRYGARYTLGNGGDHGAAVLEGLQIALNTPHGRQVIDARHLDGTAFEITIPTTGGPPVYPENAPVLEMPGMLEGQVAFSRLLNYGFPSLPAEVVEVGDRWTAQSSGPHFEANVEATATATTEYRFAGWERIDGVDCARIEGRVTADVVAPEYELHGAPIEFNGTLEGELTWFFDPATGALVRMVADTSSDGVITAAGNDTSIKQITRVRIGIV